MDTENKDITNGVTAEESHELLDDMSKKSNKLKDILECIWTAIIVLGIACVVIGLPASGVYWCITQLMLKIMTVIPAWHKLLYAICSTSVAVCLVALAINIYIRHFSSFCYD